jgi:hypothetical protein
MMRLIVDLGQDRRRLDERIETVSGVGPIISRVTNGLSKEVSYAPADR